MANESKKKILKTRSLYMAKDPKNELPISVADTPGELEEKLNLPKGTVHTSICRNYNGKRTGISFEKVNYSEIEDLLDMMIGDDKREDYSLVCYILDQNIPTIGKTKAENISSFFYDNFILFFHWLEDMSKNFCDMQEWFQVTTISTSASEKFINYMIVHGDELLEKRECFENYYRQVMALAKTEE